MLQANTTDASDPEGNYNKCKALGDCAANTAGALIGIAVEAWADTDTLEVIAPVLGGCAEGIAAAVGHMAVDMACQHLKPCPEKINVPCAATGLLFDMIGGCTSGGILGGKPPAAQKAVGVAIFDIIFQGIESLCEASGGH